MATHNTKLIIFLQKQTNEVDRFIDRSINGRLLGLRDKFAHCFSCFNLSTMLCIPATTCDIQSTGWLSSAHATPAKPFSPVADCTKCPDLSRDFHTPATLHTSRKRPMDMQRREHNWLQQAFAGTFPFVATLCTLSATAHHPRHSSRSFVSLRSDSPAGYGRRSVLQTKKHSTEVATEARISRFNTGPPFFPFLFAALSSVGHPGKTFDFATPALSLTTLPPATIRRSSLLALLLASSSLLAKKSNFECGRSKWWCAVLAFALDFARRARMSYSFAQFILTAFVPCPY